MYRAILFLLTAGCAPDPLPEGEPCPVEGYLEVEWAGGVPWAWLCYPGNPDTLTPRGCEPRYGYIYPDDGFARIDCWPGTTIHPISEE